MNKKNKLVIGLTGPNAAGKGETGKYLSKKGFLVWSLSDILRQEARKRKIEPTRENLIVLGNSLRERYGADILAKRLSKQILSSENEKFVVDSIRTVGEINCLKKFFKKSFFLVYITAPLRRRFQFIRKRARAGDPITFHQFLEVEKKEKSNSATQQQIHKCRKLANFFVNNNSTIKNLYKKIDNILSKICEK